MDRRSVNSGFQQMDWVELGVSADHHKLFILQWFELFADDSLDTWQVRTSNVLSQLLLNPARCRELLVALDAALEAGMPPRRRPSRLSPPETATARPSGETP